MPRSWKALPMPGRPGVLVKAPTFQAFQDQEYDGDTFRFRRKEAQEFNQALAILYGLSADKRVEPALGSSELIDMQQGGPKFEIWRYPTGLACRTPHDWIVYMPFDAGDAGTPLEDPMRAVETKPPSRTRRAKTASA